MASPLTLRDSSRFPHSDVHKAHPFDTLTPEDFDVIPTIVFPSRSEEGPSELVVASPVCLDPLSSNDFRENMKGFMRTSVPIRSSPHFPVYSSVSFSSWAVGSRGHAIILSFSRVDTPRVCPSLCSGRAIVPSLPIFARYFRVYRGGMQVSSTSLGEFSFLSYNTGCVVFLFTPFPPNPRFIAENPCRALSSTRFSSRDFPSFCVN